MIHTLEQTETTVFSAPAYDNHENVVFCRDEETGLKAIIGVHSTVLGPALGGLRIWNYATEAEALNDVLRLSRGMTFKNSISGLDLGGGKAVIIGDARTVKTEKLLKRFGEYVNRLNGSYITAEDVGATTRDIEIISRQTKHVAGLPESMGGGGDPSPFTAYGVLLGMKAAAKRAFGTDELRGKTIAVQGCGNVGRHLIELLAKEGAKLYISDWAEEKAYEAAAAHKAIVVGLDDIYDVDADIYAPCALGATLNDRTIPRLKCAVVAGSANNQLADEQIHGEMLRERGIIYAPDFLINAGGVINVYQETQGYNREASFARIEKIYSTTAALLELSYKEDITPQEAALRMARKRIADKKAGL
ncbi:MAG: Glu/Leu/Phe/Val dehydrogenase [Bacteroidota bacterium]